MSLLSQRSDYVHHSLVAHITAILGRAQIHRSCYLEALIAPSWTWICLRKSRCLAVCTAMVRLRIHTTWGYIIDITPVLLWIVPRQDRINKPGTKLTIQLLKLTTPS